MADVLEQKIAGMLLSDFNLINAVDVEAKWFEDRDLSQVIAVMLDNSITDLSELEQLVKGLNPLNSYDEAELSFLQFEADNVSDLDTSLEVLETRYYQRGLKHYTALYNQNPTDENYKQLNDWLRKIDERSVKDNDGDLTETIDSFELALDVGVEPGLMTFSSLDNILGNGLEGGTLFVIGARPGVGKTAFSVSLAVEALKQQDVAVDFFTLEMTKGQMLKRFVSNTAYLNSYKLKRPNERLKDDEKTKVRSHLARYREKNLNVYDSRFNVREIEIEIRRNVAKNAGKPYLAIIDYLGLIDSGDHYAKRNEQIGKITRKLKLLTNELNIPIVLLSQLNRGLENRQDKTPTLADLRESGDIEQDANIVGFLHQAEDEEETEGMARVDMILAKNREGANSKLGFYFHKPYSKFEEVGRTL